MSEVTDPNDTPYIGRSAFGVKIDDSPELRAGVEEARILRPLEFEEKLEAVHRLACGAMANAYERSIRGETEEVRRRAAKIVFQEHSLSDALRQREGCCRYQGAWFFILGYEAQLGDHHLLQAAPVRPRMNTVFNLVSSGERSQVVNIFTSTLEDKALDYSKINPDVYSMAFESKPGYDFFSYHRTGDGRIVMVINPGEHGAVPV